MFDRLDADGGGTLDIGEITALFKENGICMTKEQVANMFGEASRQTAQAQYRQAIQNGQFFKVDTRELKQKSTEDYLSMQLQPHMWKKVAKSPAALKSKFTEFNVL